MPTIQTKTSATEEILNRYIVAFINNDLEELMKDYTEKTELWTFSGAMAGLNAISSFYTYVFALLPKGGTQVDIRQTIVKHNKAFIVWRAESHIISVPLGTDSFEIINGEIVWQSMAVHVLHK